MSDEVERVGSSREWLDLLIPLQELYAMLGEKVASNGQVNPKLRVLSRVLYCHHATVKQALLIKNVHTSMVEVTLGNKFVVDLVDGRGVDFLLEGDNLIISR